MDYSASKQTYNSPQFDEYLQFEKLLLKWQTSKNPYWKFEHLSTVYNKNTTYPLWKITCENVNSIKKPQDKTTLIMTGGVHGLERIGSQLCLSMMEKYFELSCWDCIFLEKLQHLRLVFIPFVNPAGIQNRTRSNPNGIDLMRNAPIMATEKVPFLAGGHRISNRLPWYQGDKSAPLEAESQFVVDQTLLEISKSKLTLSLDIHSGFGLTDQIWFPWAFTKKPYPKLDFMALMIEKFELLHPFHIYKIEPQSKVYCTHGDLWDYIAHEKNNSLNFIPLTLELGSWMWVKKNPLQIFKLDGLFNPIKQHRLKRTIRRHQLFIDFIMRFLIFTQTENFKKIDLQNYYNKGIQKWYPHLKKIGS